MSAPGKPPLDPSALQLPPFSLDVEALDLGADVKAVGLELLETENREPVRGKDAALIWAAVFPALAANEFFVVDFFSHLDRVREFCKLHEIHFREAAERCLVLPQPGETQLEEIFQRFEVKPSASASAAQPRMAIPNSRRLSPTVASTPTSRPTPVTLAARFASRKTVGSPCSARPSGPPKSFAEFARPPKNLTSISRGLIDPVIPLRARFDALSCGC